MDDDTKISIVIDKIFIERLVYWIIIIALAVLLVISWMKDSPAGDCSGAQGNAQLQEKQTAQQPDPAQQAQPETTTPAPEAPSCDNAKRDGNETDVDCGGGCPLKCANTRACRVASDCVSGACASGVCNSTAAPKPVALSGKLELEVTKVGYTKSPTGTVKLTGVTLKITNGLAEDLEGVQAKVYVKNKAGTRCLNQQTAGTCDDMYALVNVGKVPKGSSATHEYIFDEGEYMTRMGKFLVEDNGYEPADSSYNDFNVVAYLYDAAGEPINGKTVVSSLLVNP